MKAELDLLGDPIVPTKSPVKKPSKPRAMAYPALPGSGPAGYVCLQCKNYRSVLGGARRYPKCELMRGRWSHGPGTDIKAHAPACSKFQHKP